jgi:hypothetical protein
MKYALLLGGLLLLPLFARAQVFVNGVNINAEKINFCQLTGQNQANGTQVWIDYGQRGFSRTMYPHRINGKGTGYTHNSVISVLNIVTQNGWELVSTQIIVGKDGQQTFTYLLRKK